MQHRNVIGWKVRYNTVVVIRIPGRGVERFVAALRAANEVKPMRGFPVAFADNFLRHIVCFLYRFLAIVQQRFIVQPKPAVETGSTFVATIATESYVALLERRRCTCRL